MDNAKKTFLGISARPFPNQQSFQPEKGLRNRNLKIWTKEINFDGSNLLARIHYGRTSAVTHSIHLIENDDGIDVFVFKGRTIRRQTNVIPPATSCSRNEQKGLPLLDTPATPESPDQQDF